MALPAFASSQGRGFKRACGSRKDVIRPEDSAVCDGDIEQKQLKGATLVKTEIHAMLCHVVFDVEDIKVNVAKMPATCLQV